MNLENISHNLNKDFSLNFLNLMKKRRSCRWFSDEKVDIEVLKNCIQVAATAPSGGNTQPWFFCLVINKEIKQKIRDFAEQEEKDFYFNKASTEFLNDLKPFNTNWQKPHLTESGALIVIFAKTFNHINEEKKRCYYPKESTGIATGMLITALHLCGYDTLTHTPSPMMFLNKILSRPNDEKPFLILAVGNKHKEYRPPDLCKKKFTEYADLV